ncbi:hypothetical protein [Jidongwangia harbinensis]|uniref:hypothetical protein n=1 Tax=Jidongwangia harbinensis TaxID=2878561 RepID=UPI001CD9BD66|nr:hypothetical protein [Jidongwangia harbinensis]MCA2211871.1 hypothetical protein [Jidongwangia harbinensis]
MSDDDRMAGERLHEGEQPTGASPVEARRQPAVPAVATGNAALARLAADGGNPIAAALLSSLGPLLPNSVLAQAAQQGALAALSPAGLPAGEYTVIVVGSPGPGEVKVRHAFQFADAAARVGGTSPVWLVERTGYELAGVGTSGIESRAKGAPIYWITPGTSMAALLRQFPPKSIVGLHVFSHGVPEQLALRYDWPGKEDYGLSISEARTLTPEAFHPQAAITFDSCNTATVLSPGLRESGRGLAGEVADATERPVTAWTGRTSYRLVNKGTGDVVGSQIKPGGLNSIDLTEVLSQARGRTPEKVLTAPARSAGDWTSVFRMTARLPETRKFPVPENGSVTVTIEASSEYPAMQGAEISVILHRVVDWGRDEDHQAPQGVVVGKASETSWPGLPAGEYYLELFHLSGLEVEGSISVTIQ